jgi:hypothetical protein
MIGPYLQEHHMVSLYRLFAFDANMPAAVPGSQALEKYRSRQAERLLHYSTLEKCRRGPFGVPHVSIVQRTTKTALQNL